ncbi:MAG TPA: hypothetical protein VF927_11640 [Solirubrobacteraceae bacterium]
MLLLALALSGCGHSSRRPASTAAKTPPGPPQPSRPAFGITEDNADLLWNPAATAPPQAAAFLPARRELTALHPRYIRLLIDWAALQPSAQNPPDLRAPVSGCARQVGPCGNYEGVAGELAAIASQQRAARAEGRQGFDVVIDILGAPAWAALPPHGCELAATPASARPIGGAALAGYRALIAGLLALAAREGVQLPWWSPWNEPNDPRFLAPQRAACGPDAEPLAPAVYSQLAEAMAAELKAAGGEHRILLGELGGYDRGSPHRLSIGQFLDGLPANVLCLGNTWAVHAYAARGRRAIEPDPVRALERALDARVACASGARIWVTESGAGAPSPGRAREGGVGEELGACEALAAQTGKWNSDPRVEAIFQYEFRDDPAFPVGVASADLSRLRSTYRVWLALGRAQEGASPVSTPTGICVP